MENTFYNVPYNGKNSNYCVLYYKSWKNLALYSDNCRIIVYYMTILVK